MRLLCSTRRLLRQRRYARIKGTIEWKVVPIDGSRLEFRLFRRRASVSIYGLGGGGGAGGGGGRGAEVPPGRGFTFSRKGCRCRSGGGGLDCFWAIVRLLYGPKNFDKLNICCGY